MLAAGGNDGALGGDVLAVEFLEVTAHGGPQLGDAGHGRVTAEIGVDGGLGGLTDMLGGGEVRFAHGQAGDLYALGPQLHGAGIDAEGQRGLHGAHTFGNLHRVLLAWNRSGRTAARPLRSRRNSVSGSYLTVNEGPSPRPCVPFKDDPWKKHRCCPFPKAVWWGVSSGVTSASVWRCCWTGRTSGSTATIPAACWA